MALNHQLTCSILNAPACCYDVRHRYCITVSLCVCQYMYHLLCGRRLGRAQTPRPAVRPHTPHAPPPSPTSGSLTASLTSGGEGEGGGGGGAMVVMGHIIA